MMKTKYLVLGSVLLVTACGFEPMYGTTRFNTPTAQQAALETQLQSIEIENIPDREGQVLRNLLIDRFYTQGRPDKPRYSLNVSTLKESIYDLDITKQSDATRAQLKLETTMTLKDNATGQILMTRPLKGMASYNILTSEFATRISEDNTRKNVLNDLAGQIERQIGLYFNKK